MFVKMSPCDLLFCFAVFHGMSLLALLFLLPDPICFLEVCRPTLLAAVLKFLPPLTTSATSGSANSNKLASTCFATGKISLRKTRIAVLRIICASAPVPTHVVDQYLHGKESLRVLKQPSCKVI